MQSAHLHMLIQESTYRICPWLQHMLQMDPAYSSCHPGTPLCSKVPQLCTVHRNQLLEEVVLQALALLLQSGVQ